MKIVFYSIIVIMFSASAIGFFSCKPIDVAALEEELMDFLVEKPGGWSMESVDVPPSTVTASDDWKDFELDVLPSRMNTKGHPSGGIPVWPSGEFELADDGKTIAREDGVVMDVKELTATRLVVTFNYSDDTGGTDGRVASLDGEYTFTMK